MEDKNHDRSRSPAKFSRLRTFNGAALVQLYSGMIYRGPGLVKEIVKAI